MRWILSAELLFGIWFACRMLSDLVASHLIIKKSAITVGVSVILFFGGVTILARHHPALQIVLIITVCAVLASARFYFQYRLQITVQSEFPGFIDRIILAMKTGLSFRAAVDHALARPLFLWEKWLRIMIDSRVFLNSGTLENTKWWQNLVTELQTVQKNPHHALARLENLRRKLRVVSEFRRKSGHALLQARIQIVVMTVMYLALLVMTMKQFQIHRYSRLISLSVVLFFAGQVTFWWIARKRRWKV
jgi:Flp pilus assembly protein TadB